MIQLSPAGERTPREGRFLLALLFAGVGALAMLAAWLAPNHYPPWTAFHGEASAFAALILFAAARLAWPEPLVRSPVALVAAALLLLIVVQWRVGKIGYGGDAYVSALYVSGAALAFWLGTNSAALRTRLEPMLWLAWIVVAAAGISVVLAHLQWLRMESVAGIFVAERDPDMRAYANLGQPNHLATLLMMAAVLTVLLHAAGALGRVGCAALALWFAWGLTLSESRSGLLSAFCAGAFLVANARVLPSLARPRWVGAWLTLLVVLALMWPAINQAMYLQEPRGALAARDSARQIIWKQCIAGIEASPWFGYGWRQSIVGQKAGVASVAGPQVSDYAHNIMLDLMLWVGVPLALVLIGVGAWWLLRLVRRLQGAKEILLFVSILPILVHSMFEFPFAYSYFLFPASWGLGLLGELRRERTATDSRPGSWAWPAAAVVLFAIAAWAAASEYLKAEEDYRVMRFELRRVGRTPEGYESPHLAVLTQLDEMLKAGRIKPRPDMSSEDMARLREGTVRFGWATLHLAYAVSLALNHDPAQAERELRQLRASYGPESYAQAVRIWREMQTQYPQLSAVRIP